MNQRTESQANGASAPATLTVRTVLETLHAHALAFQRQKEAEGKLSDSEATQLDEEIETGRLLIELLCESGVDQALGQRAKNSYDALLESLDCKNQDLDRYHAAFMSDEQDAA